MDSRELLGHLIAFDTVSRDSNLALIGFVRDYLHDHGVSCELIHADDGRKANLWATIGPDDKGGVVLSGHTDVVPVDGQPWTRPPFEMTEDSGRLYGRGAADMKGYLACVLAAVPRFLDTNLKVPVHIAFSYDEELGCLGVRSLIEMIGNRAHKPVACIIGEPTGLRPCVAHKGKLGGRIHVHGAACHSAHAPSGVNAISHAARLVGKLDEIGKYLADPSRRDPRFDPPFSTVQVGTIQGGQALNIVPADCAFDWEVRTLPDLDAREVETELKAYAEQELVPGMRETDPDTGIRFEQLMEYPGLVTDEQSDVARLVATLAQRDDFGTVAFGTEGGLFHQAGVPTVVCGPGNMDQGHKPDEFITVDQLDKCDAMMSRLAAHAAA